MPVDHYENFPVASVLLPARMRAPVEAIYAFARGADDIADEGDLPDAERLAGLDAYLLALDAIEQGRDPGAGFHRIASAVREWQLPPALLRDLIDAFAQDVVKKRYATFAELLDYSRRSANPDRAASCCISSIGVRPRFSAHGKPGSEPRKQSDAICSSLQLINFWQDVAREWAKGRVSIPQEDLARFGVGEADIAAGRTRRRAAGGG